jgi:hypothetical protein
VKRHKGAALATDPVAAGLDLVIAIPDPVVLSPLLLIFIISSAHRLMYCCFIISSASWYR